MKVYKYAVMVDGFPYKSYQTITGAKMFVQKISKKDKRERKIEIVKIGSWNKNN